METFKTVTYWALYVPRFLWRLFLNVWGKLAKGLVGWDEDLKVGILLVFSIFSFVITVMFLVLSGNHLIAFALMLMWIMLLAITGKLE